MVRTLPGGVINVVVRVLPGGVINVCHQFAHWAACCPRWH